VEWTVERTVVVTAQGNASEHEIRQAAIARVRFEFGAQLARSLLEDRELTAKLEAVVAARGTRESAMGRIEYLRERQQSFWSSAREERDRAHELQARIRELETNLVVGSGVQQSAKQLFGLSRDPMAGFHSQMNDLAADIGRQKNLAKQEELRRGIAAAEQLAAKFDALAERAGAMADRVSEGIYSLAYE
jgi:hypothetical protein